MNVLLIGYRGTGKSSVARRLAQRLGWIWIDADEELEQRAGKTIAQIFADDGEPAFRRLESDVLADLVAMEKCVIALGGGAVLRAQNRELIKAAGPVVWLTAGAQTIIRRITNDETTSSRRPNLTSQGGLEEVRELLAVREPFYRDCATIVIDTDGKSAASVADEIYDKLNLPPAHCATAAV